MSISEATQNLEAVFRDDREALGMFAARERMSARDLFIRLHLPLLILYPVFSFLAPYHWIFSSFSWKRNVFFPTAVALSLLLIAAIFDKINEHADLQPMEPVGRDGPLRQIALYLHLPVSASGMFFFIHPAVGMMALTAAGIYSAIISIRAWAIEKHLNRAISLQRYIWALVLPMIPILLIAGLLNISRTIRVFRELL